MRLWLAVSTVLFFIVPTASALTIFQETFEGYTSFPVQSPYNDPINPGRPRQSEGSDEDWIGARFELGDNGTIDQDIAVQQFGGGSNNTHTGRVEDDAGLVAKLDLTLYSDATVSFDWRTFLASTNDRFVVMYYVGDGLGATNANHDWFADPAFGNGQMVSGGPPTCGVDASPCNPWVRDNWTELLRGTRSNAWQSESFALPVGDTLYLAFWMDNGEGDFAKFDNVLIDATLVPEPSTALLLGLGLAGLASRRTPKASD